MNFFAIIWGELADIIAVSNLLKGCQSHVSARNKGMDEGTSAGQPPADRRNEVKVSIAAIGGIIHSLTAGEHPNLTFRTRPRDTAKNR